MKIAYIVPSLKNVGPVLVVKELVEQMEENGHQCHVFYFDNKIELKFCCSTTQIGFTSSFDFNNFDIVHTHGLRPDAYVYMHKPLHTKTRFVSTLHNYVFRDLSYQYNKLTAYVFGYVWIKLLLNRNDCVVALSRDAVSYYKKWIKQFRLTWAYNTRSLPQKEKLTSEELEQLQCFKQDSILIGVNALLTERKGVDLLIIALSKLPEYKLFVVGDGKTKSQLIQLTKKYNVDDRVCFAGYHKDAFRYLPYYDIFAMPSRSEGFPLALLEASIVGVSTVCSDIPVFKELYSEKEVSFFKLENIESLVSSIKNITNTKSYSVAIHRRYVDTYTPHAFYQRYIGIYQFLLKENTINKD